MIQYDVIREKMSIISNYYNYCQAPGPGLDQWSLTWSTYIGPSLGQPGHQPDQT